MYFLHSFASLESFAFFICKLVNKKLFAFEIMLKVRKKLCQHVAMNMSRVIVGNIACFIKLCVNLCSTKLNWIKVNCFWFIDFIQSRLNMGSNKLFASKRGKHLAKLLVKGSLRVTYEYSTVVPEGRII